MNKKTFANLMSVEKKKYEENVEKFRQLNTAKKLAMKRATTSHGEDQLSFKKAIEAEFSTKSVGIISGDSIDLADLDQYYGGEGPVCIPTSATTTDPVYTAKTTTDVINLLKAILDKQNETSSRIANLEARMCTLENSIEDFHAWSKENTRGIPEEIARDKMIRESKVLAQKVHKSICRLTGEDQNESETDIASSLPIASYEEAHAFEQKMIEPAYKAAVKLRLVRLKGSGAQLEKLFRELYSDDFIKDCNWEGRNGKHSLIQFSLASDLLYDVSDILHRPTYHRAIRKCIEKSHQRNKQRNFLQRRKAD
ncbi:uncharacterized protein [Eurosta solidaginis]|uniref:uncharacterized protein isoform X1 n=1 Tax=Eurosta solidaginis TaxID=178769 RepID=UPI003530CC96